MKATTRQVPRLTLLLLALLLLALVTSVHGDDADTATTAAATDDTKAEPPVPEETTPNACEGKLALVTGATGRVGSMVTRNLLHRGFCVRVLSRNSTKAHDVLGDLFNTDTNSKEHPVVELVIGELGDGISVAKAFEPRETSGSAAISHVIFAAGGEEADYDAVNRRGVAECAQEAAKANVESMVLISTAWASKPYSLASLLFNYFYPNLPMARHLQGEDALKRAGLKHYVILRAGRLVSDEEYPTEGRQGLTYKQGDSFFFFGPAGMPGMSTTQLATAVLTAARVKGRFTVEVTGRGKVDPQDLKVFMGTSQTPPELRQDSDSAIYLASDADAERFHAKAVHDFQVGMVFVLVVATAFTILIPLGKQWSMTWKVILFVSLLLETLALFLIYWNTFRCGLSVRDCVAREQASASSSPQEL